MAGDRRRTDTVADLYKNYIICSPRFRRSVGFIKGSIIGYSAFGVTVRTPIGAGITGMILGYALTLALVYVVALIVDALAPTFGGRKIRSRHSRLSPIPTRPAGSRGIGA